MNRRILSFVLAAVMIFGLFPVAARAEETEQEQPVTITISAEEDYDAIVEALAKINDYRSYQELAPLSLNATLTEAAMLRASEVGLFYDENGTRPDGTSVWDLEVFASGDWTDLTEFVDPKSTASSVYISLIHNEKLSPKVYSGDYSQIGIGCSDGRWVVLIGKSDTDTAAVNQQGKVFAYHRISVFPSLLNPHAFFEFGGCIWPNDSSILEVTSSNRDYIDYTQIVPIIPDTVLNRKGEVIATMELTDTEYQHGVVKVTWVTVGGGDAIVYLDEEMTVPLKVGVSCINSEGNIPTPTPDPNARDAGTWGDNLTWTLEGTTLTISGQGDMEPEVYGESVYPWTYYRDAVVELVIENGVTSIADRAFTYFSELEQIALPDSLTTIGEGAFSNNPKLRSAELPDSVTSVGAWAFSNCTVLESIRLSESLTALPSYLVSSTPITEIHIPESVTAMGEGVFMCCTKLESVVLPEGLTEVSSRCFESCSGLSSVTLPGNLTALNDSAFSGCSSLTAIELPETLERIGTYCFHGTALQSIVIPDSVTFLGHYAFWGCQQLSRVVLPDRIPDLTIHSFEDCPNLTIACHVLSKSYLLALENDIPVEILPEDPGTPLYPVSVYANDGGTIMLSSEYSPAGRYVLVQIQPEETHMFAAMYYYRTDGVEEELEIIQLGELEYLIEMPPCEMILDVSFLLREVPFADVPMEQYYYVPVLWAVTNGITAGTSATSFSPDASCTRAQVVTFLWRTAGEPEPSITENPFVDVKPGDYYYKAVLWAVEKGITAGTDATHFSPETGCTRAQVVTFLWRACGKPEYNPDAMGFADVYPDDYYHDAVRWAAEYQITSGVNSTHFAPDTICTRGQIVTFLFRTFF